MFANESINTLATVCIYSIGAGAVQARSHSTLVDFSACVAKVCRLITADTLACMFPLSLVYTSTVCRVTHQTMRGLVSAQVSSVIALDSKPAATAPA